MARLTSPRCRVRESPELLGAICHTPLDLSLATYEAEPGEASIDKWGNEVSDAKAMTASYHRIAGATCLDCHKAHRASVNDCSRCHADSKIPEGWLTAAQSKMLETA